MKIFFSDFSRRYFY